MPRRNLLPVLGGRRLWPDPGALSESGPRPGLSAQGPLRRPPALGGVGAPVPLQQARLPLPAAEEGLRAWTRHCIFITKLPGEITATAAHLLCCRKACFSPSFFISWCIVNAAWASAAWLLGICGGSAVLGVGRTWPRDSRWAAAHRPPSRADHEKGTPDGPGVRGRGLPVTLTVPRPAGCRPCPRASPGPRGTVSPVVTGFPPQPCSGTTIALSPVF